MKHLGLNIELFSRQSLDGLAYPRVSLIGLAGVDVRDSSVIGVVNQIVEFFVAETALYGAADGSGPYAEPTQPDPRVAEGDLVGGRLFRLCREYCRSGSQGDAGRRRRALDKLAPRKSILAHCGVSAPIIAYLNRGSSPRCAELA